MTDCGLVLCAGKKAKGIAQKAAKLPKEGTSSDVLVCGMLVAGKDAKATAQKAAKAVKKGTFKKERKPRYTVTFHRPKTLKRTRTPKYPKQRYGVTIAYAPGVRDCRAAG